MKVFILLSLISLNVYAEKMPDFSLPIYQKDEKFVLSNNLKSKKVLINFWASWCTSCIHEIPILEELKKKYDNKVTFISVNAGEKSNLIDKFIKKYNFSYLHLKDEDRAFSKSININSLPVTIVVDHEMNVVYRDVVPPKEL